MDSFALPPSISGWFDMPETNPGNGGRHEQPLQKRTDKHFPYIETFSKFEAFDARSAPALPQADSFRTPTRRERLRCFGTLRTW